MHLLWKEEWLDEANWPDDEPIAQDYMIDWLGQTGPEAWHAVALRANWDSMDRVLAWIIDQEGCDFSTASYVMAQGDWLFPFKYPHPDGRPPRLAELARKLLSNHARGRYRLHGFGLGQDLHGAYDLLAQDYARARTRFDLDFTIPDAFFKPPEGRAAQFPAGFDPRSNGAMKSLFLAMGVDIR